MINGLVDGGALGHGIWVEVKDKVMGIMELPHSHCKKVYSGIALFLLVLHDVTRQIFPASVVFHNF